MVLSLHDDLEDMVHSCYRKEETREKNASWNKTNQNITPRRAKAQASTATSEKMKYGKAYRIATINIRGAKRQGTGEEVEAWMKKKQNIDIAHIQETRIGINAREARNEYTWYFRERTNTSRNM